MRVKSQSAVALVTVIFILSILILASPLLFSVTSSTSGGGSNVAHLQRLASGFVASDGLKSGNLSRWNMQGDAPLELAPYTYLENSSGLYIGAEANESGQWAGFFAETPVTYASLFHARLTLPYSSIPNGEFNTGIYVQTAAISNVNYIFCGAQAEQGGYYWSVSITRGTPYGITNETTLYSKPENTGPLTEGCTIITNGNNSLSVYLGGSFVYSSQSLRMDIPAPFNVYLEVETTNAQEMLYGNYSNYYASASLNINVTRAPPLGTVQLVNSSGGSFGTYGIGTNGNASIPVGQDLLPLNLTLNVYDEHGNLTASTFEPLNLWGGDVYAASNSTEGNTNSTTNSISSHSNITLPSSSTAFTTSMFSSVSSTSFSSSGYSSTSTSSPSVTLSTSSTSTSYTQSRASATTHSTSLSTSRSSTTTSTSDPSSKTTTASAYTRTGTSPSEASSQLHTTSPSSQTAVDSPLNSSTIQPKNSSFQVATTRTSEGGNRSILFTGSILTAIVVSGTGIFVFAARRRSF